MKLNLGAGSKRFDDYLSVDSHPMFEPDQLVDLNQTPWPWEDESITSILAFHVFEHLSLSPVAIAIELHRIMAPGSKAVIRLPHPRSDDFLNDPTHLRAYTPETFGFFSKKTNLEWQANGWANTPLAFMHNIDLVVEKCQLVLKPNWHQRLGGDMAKIIDAVQTFNNVCSEFEITLLKPESSDAEDH